jgi:hypothetical protein
MEAALDAHDDAFDVYPEIFVDPAALAKWKGDKKGAIVGDMLAKKLGMHVGDKVILEGRALSRRLGVHDLRHLYRSAAVGRRSIDLLSSLGVQGRRRGRAAGRPVQLGRNKPG